MNDDTIYSNDIQELLEAKISPYDIGIDLKNSEDLESDLVNYILEIERVQDWGETPPLVDLHDLLRLIQQEVVFNNPITDFRAYSPYIFVAYANMLFTPGMVIGKNVARAHEIVQNVLTIAPTYEYALATLGSLLLIECDAFERDPAAAYDLFMDVLNSNPEYVFALTNLGELLRRGDDGVEKNLKAAYHYFHRALEHDPHNLTALQSISYIYLTGDEFEPEKALPYLSKLVELDSSNAFALSALADQLKESDLKKAHELLEEALVASPDYVPALGLLGEVLRNGGDGVEQDRVRARSLLEKAVELDPEYDFALRGLGELYMRGAADGVQDYDIAYNFFERSYQLCNDSPFGLNHLAELCWRKQEYQRAKELATASLQLNPDQSYPLCLLGVVEFALTGTVDLARPYFEQALALDPNFYDTLYYYGNALNTSDLIEDKVKARELFLRALEIDPDDADMLKDVGWLFYTIEESLDAELALEYVTRSIALDEESASSHLLIGLILVEEEMVDRYKEAYEHLQKSYALDPDNAYTRYWLAILLMRGLGGVPVDLEQARLLLEAALTDCPDDADFLELQSELIEKMIDKKSALTKCTQFIKSLFLRDAAAGS
ncbi:MAG: SEL1-like repeat protein [Verrucomicrobia bacterium]|nr:SEL1-like repeat protein [Verrucomicrobiota bacterium]